MRSSTQSLWTRRFPESVRLEDGRMYVDLGAKLCVLDMPRVVGLGLQEVARFDQYVLPIYQHAPRQWYVFVEPNGLLDWEVVRDCRRAGVVTVETGTLELDVPGTGSPQWVADMVHGRAWPMRKQLMELVITMTPAQALV